MCSAVAFWELSLVCVDTMTSYESVGSIKAANFTLLQDNFRKKNQ